MTAVIIAVTAAVSCIVGFLICYVYTKKISDTKIGGAKQQAEAIVSEAKRTSEAFSKEMLLEAKEESIKIKHEAEKEAKEHRAEVQKLEKRLLQKEKR